METATAEVPGEETGVIGDGARSKSTVEKNNDTWLQRKLAKEAVASASAHTFTHWGVKCGGEEGEAKAAL
jgi:hypothetical protein